MRHRNMVEETKRRYDSGASRDRESSVRTTEEHLESLYQQQAHLIGVLKAPCIELQQYDGDPRRYFAFMRAFQDNVEETIPDDSAPLAQIVLHCEEANAH